MRKPRDISAINKRRKWVGTASVCWMAWGLETALAAEKCAHKKAEVATKCE